MPAWRRALQHPATPRLAALLAVLVGLWAIAASMGWTDDLDIDKVRALVKEAGPWGVLVYLAVFAGGELAHIPGMVFVLAGIAIWGRVEGLFVAYSGAVVSVTTSFLVVRGVGGRTLGMIDNKWLQRALAELDKRPLTTVIVVRLLFWLAPLANYMLALSPLRFSHFLLGSAIGLLPPVALVTWLFELAMQWFGK